MKHISLLAALIAVLFVSCTDPQDPNPSYKSRGVITGPDYRKCSSICCGGWFIEIDGNVYRFLELPPNSDVKLAEAVFPIPVRLSWSVSPEGTQCHEPVIIVHAIAKE